MNNCKISVVVPTYKPKDYLWQCLDSLSNQTLPKQEFEVVLILNGCRSPYLEKIMDYKNATELCLQVYQTDEGGVSNARNIGIKNAVGDYITFIDDDDYVSDCYLQCLLDVSNSNVIGLAHPVAFRGDDIVEYVIEKEYHNILDKGAVPFYTVKKVFQGPCMKLFHKDIIGNRKFDTFLRNGEDALFMFQISDKFNLVVTTPEDAIYYRRIREDGASYSKKALLYKIKNSLYMILNYFGTYITSPQKYSFKFFFTRVLGAIRMIINN